MANRHMFLVHKPSGKRQSLGKRMGSNWYVSGFFGSDGNPSLKDSLNEFYASVDNGKASDYSSEQDDFIIEFTD